MLTYICWIFLDMTIDGIVTSRQIHAFCILKHGTVELSITGGMGKTNDIEIPATQCKYIWHHVQMIDQRTRILDVSYRFLEIMLYIHDIWSYLIKVSPCFWNLIIETTDTTTSYILCKFCMPITHIMNSPLTLCSFQTFLSEYVLTIIKSQLW